MIRASRLRGVALVDIDRAEKIGEVGEVFLDPAGRRVAGFGVRRGPSLLAGEALALVPAASVRAIGPDAITVGGVEATFSDSRLAALPRLSQVLGRKVVTAGGRALGPIVDVLVEPTNGWIVGYTLGSPGGALRGLFGGPGEDEPAFVRADAPLRVGRELVVVPDDAIVSRRELGAGSEGLPAAPTATGWDASGAPDQWATTGWDVAEPADEPQAPSWQVDGTGNEAEAPWGVDESSDEAAAGEPADERSAAATGWYAEAGRPPGEPPAAEAVASAVDPVPSIAEHAAPSTNDAPDGPAAWSPADAAWARGHGPLAWVQPLGVADGSTPAPAPYGNAPAAPPEPYAGAATAEAATGPDLEKTVPITNRRRRRGGSAERLRIARATHQPLEGT